MADQTHEAVATLEYGQDGSHRRRQWVRICIIAAILLAIYPVKRWGPTAWHQFTLLRAQRACLNYHASPDSIVYDENEANAATLLAADAQYSAYPFGREAPPPLPKKIHTAAAFTPRSWTRFDATCAQAVPCQLGSIAGAIVFLGERTSPRGHRRLVCVEYSPDRMTFTPAFIPGFDFDAKVITPATLNAAPVQAPRVYALDVVSGWPRHPPQVRLWAGQADLNDPSHFTIRYEMWGQQDVLDGRLLDNDDVTLTPRHLPEDRG